MEENKQLQLLDVLGIPINPFLKNKNYNQENIIFNHREKTLIYPLGSNIIHYNIKKDSKTILQYFSSIITLVKFINDLENILLIITKSSFPILSIWEIPSFIGLYSQEIITHPNFEVNDIFMEKINPLTYLILITNKNNNSDNFLYILNKLKNGKYDLMLFGKLKYIITKINGFGIFYNSNEIVFLMTHNLQYYSIDLENEKCLMKKNINFSFKLKENSMKISKLNNLLCVLTDKGNCLIYDRNGTDKTTINPLGQECFTTCEFSGDSLCIGTSHGNVYVYNIYEFNLKYMINYNDFYSIKNLSLINKNNINGKINLYNYNTDNEIIFISLNERLDQIFILFKENSFAFMSVEQLINKEKFSYNINSLKINNTIFYSFNHSNKILDIQMNPKNKNNFNDSIFYTCSQDNKLIKYYIDQNSDKLQNQYYDLNQIISTSKQNNIIKNYLTVLKIHPSFINKLFAGDNKGFLYIININIDSKNSVLKYRKYNIGSYEIIFLTFSNSGNLLCIGFETGYQLIYKTKEIFECVLKINEHYLNFENIEYRKENNHILAYCSFFKNKRNRHCIIYTKDHNIIEYAKLFKSEDGFSLTKKNLMEIAIENTILDLVLHPSETYIIILNDKKQILMNNILINKITAVIDLNNQIEKLYNIQIDISGLYLAIVCDINKLKDKKNTRKNGDINKNDLIIIEISTSKVKNYIIQMNPISKLIFDIYGKYIIIGGESGDISLWRLPGEISSSIKKILNEIEFDINFWDKYEIKYNNQKDKDSSIFSLVDSEKNYSLDDKNSNSFYNNIITNNNIYKNYNTNYNNRIKDNEFQNIKNLNRVKAIKKRNKYIKKHLNGLPKINDENNINKLFKSHNFNENNYTDDGIYNKLRNKSQKFINNKKYILQNMHNKDHYYLSNNILNNDNLNQRNKNICEFWSKSDTINIKKTINMNGNYKHPEPIDIDADL